MSRTPLSCPDAAQTGLGARCAGTTAEAGTRLLARLFGALELYLDRFSAPTVQYHAGPVQYRAVSLQRDRQFRVPGTSVPCRLLRHRSHLSFTFHGFSAILQNHDLGSLNLIF